MQLAETFAQLPKRVFSSSPERSISADRGSLY
jgi:hypothetical protein